MSLSLFHRLFQYQNMATSTRVAIIPGNGGGDVEDCNWYSWVRDRINEIDCATSILRNMPDPELAREKYWIPFMHDELSCDTDTIVLGHSSGAEAAMRYAEKYKVKGIVLVSAYITDLGDSCERKSGYFNRPWEWTKIKENTGFIAQFGSTDDPFVPFSEQQAVAKLLNSDFQEFSNKGHFCMFKFPEVVNLIRKYFEIKCCSRFLKCLTNV